MIMISEQPPQKRNARMRHALRVYGYLEWAHLRARMQYPVNFAVGFLVQAFTVFVNLTVLAVILGRFQTIKGWTFWEAGFMFGMWWIGRAIHRILAFHLTWLSNRIREGTLDRILIRPVSPFIQILGEQLNIQDLSRLIAGVAIVVFTSSGAHVMWGPATVLWFLAVVTAAAIIETCIGFLSDSLAFWIVQASALRNLLYQFYMSFGQFPLDIYGRTLLGLLTFVVPYAFIIFYPAHVFFGKEGKIIFGPWLAYVSPLVAIMLVGISYTVWRCGLKRYQSTGT